MPNTTTAPPVPRESRAARAVRVLHKLESTTYNLPDSHHGSGWSAVCTCGATTGETRYRERGDAEASHAGHVRRYLPAGS